MVRIGSCAAALLYALSVVVSAGMLPAVVPLHFGPDGSADRYGSRSGAVIGWKTPEHEPELRRRLQVDLTGFFVATFLLLAAIPASTAVAAGASSRLPDAFGVALALYLAGTLAWGVHTSTRPVPAERASR